MLTFTTFWFLPITTNLIIAALTFISLAAPGAPQQAKERVVKIITLRDQPIDIIAVRVKGGPVEADRKFKGDSDWFNGMTVTIKNVSDRPIVFATVLVTAPHEKNGVRKQIDGLEFIAGVDLMYGVRPLLPGQPPRDYRAVTLFSGQTADLMFSERLRDQLYFLLTERDSSTDISELTLRLKQVFFENDEETMWSNGFMLRRDSKNPMRWNTIEPPKRNHGMRELKHAVPVASRATTRSRNHMQTPAPCITQGRPQAFTAPVTMVDSFVYGITRSYK